jgi:hypothetical protein
MFIYYRQEGGREEKEHSDTRQLMVSELDYVCIF